MTSNAQGKMYVLVWSDDGEVKAVVNDNGRIPVQVEGVDVRIDVNIESQDAALDVTESSPLTVIDSRVHGYLGAAWQKLQMLWGYTERWAQRIPDTASGMETIILSSTAVEAGYVYVLQNASVVCITDVCTTILVQVTSGTVHPGIIYKNPPVVGVPDWWTGEMVLKQGDQVTATFTDAADNTLCILDIWGYKMKISD